MIHRPVAPASARAAAVLTGGYDYRGDVKSALLACELGLKSGAAAQGLGESEIMDRFVHRLGDLADAGGQGFAAFDRDRVRRVLAGQPQYVPNIAAMTDFVRQRGL